jgi:hypothetical protein
MTLRHATERRSTRRHVDLPCQAVAEEGFRFLGGQVIDLSPEGMQVSSAAQVRVGEPVLVSFRAPHSDDWMDAEAVVARVIRGQRGGDRGRAIGLRFTQQSSFDRVMLRERLRNLTPPTPARQLRRDYAGFVRGVDFFSTSSLARHGFEYLGERL